MFFSTPPVFSASTSFEKNYIDRHEPGVDYLAFNQGFPSSHSIWNSIGGAPNGKVYVAVANHLNDVGLFVYNSKTKKMKFLGTLGFLGGFTKNDWHAKVHSIIDYNPNDGYMYFGTDAGVHKGSGLLEHPLGHKGGVWFRIDPKTDKVESLGRSRWLLNVKGLALDLVNNRIYWTSYDQTHLYIYDIAKKTHRDMGRYNTWHTPRMPWSDAWGNGYVSGAHGEIHKYEVHSEKFIEYKKTRIPRWKFESDNQVAAGVAAACYSKDRKKAYLVNNVGQVFIHEMAEKGPGKIVPLGDVVPGNNKPLEIRANASNIAVLNNRLYLAVGGHGKFVPGYPTGTSVLVEVDLKKKKKRVIGHFNNKIVTELTGNGYVDSKGWIYQGGHGQSLYSSNFKGSAAPRRPWLVRFKPDKMPDYNKNKWVK